MTMYMRTATTPRNFAALAWMAPAVGLAALGLFAMQRGNSANAPSFAASPTVTSAPPETAAPSTAASEANAVPSTAPAPVPTRVATSLVASEPVVPPVAPAYEQTSRTPSTTDDPGYPTAPDGTPLPINVVYGAATVTLTGEVPTVQARDLLEALAVANAARESEVVNQLQINPAVPFGIGIRVIELESPRFPEGSATIQPAHLLQFDRVAKVMAALPNVTVLVIGHSDQRGSEDTNFDLSDRRARAVVDYLVGAGVTPSRLSSRAAGESDLLTLSDDDAALALNRRTEFVFYGVLAG